MYNFIKEHRWDPEGAQFNVISIMIEASIVTNQNEKSSQIDFSSYDKSYSITN
jgi:hypothetical protein